MSRASTEMMEAQKLFQQALTQDLFTAEELKAMLMKASQMMNKFELNNMLEETEQLNLDELFMNVD